MSLPLTTTARCRYGMMTWFTADFGVGAMLSKYGEYFEGEVALMRRLLRPGDTVVSAGGNIGVHLVPLSQIVGFGGRVITFEPQEACRNVLRRNMQDNACDNVDVHPEAIGEVAGIAHFPPIDYNSPNNFGGMELRETGITDVNVVTLDSFALDACHMLMLDVEGFELPALRGARETIEKHRPYLYVEIDRPDKRDAVLGFMREMGYEICFHTPPAFEATNFAGNAKNEYGNIVSIMALGIPR